MASWDTNLKKPSWARSLLLKSGILGLGILSILWAGWPQPQKNGQLDHSSVPIVLSEDKRIQKVHHESRPVTGISKNRSFESERKSSVFQATQVPLLDLNGSSRMELETLPGIGMVLASRIVSYRTAHGDFQRIEDLINVLGIGTKRLKRLEPLVTVKTMAGDIES